MVKVSLSKNLLQRIPKVQPNALHQIHVKSLEEKAKLLVIRDLHRLGWRSRFSTEAVTMTPPDTYSKEIIRESMSLRRADHMFANAKWLERMLPIVRENLASGKDALESSVKPRFEVCKTAKQMALFRALRHYWSSPYTDYVGRRIRIIIRDDGLPTSPVLGIAAIGSSIIHIPERDDWVGWDTQTRSNRIIYTMDAYVLGALPPYNHLLGGKLVAYMLASNEFRRIYKRKYQSTVTNIKKRKASHLVCLFTTGLYGKSAQYNRIRYAGQNLYHPVGYTKGFGSLHLSEETFDAMLQFLREAGIEMPNRFGDGPNWRMRVIRTAGALLGFDEDFLLRHSFKRSIYAVPLATNWQEYLQGKARAPQFHDWPLSDLVDYWRRRWLEPRRQRPDVIQSLGRFSPKDFSYL
jgi:hypothetical protein